MDDQRDDQRDGQRDDHQSDGQGRMIFTILRLPAVIVLGLAIMLIVGLVLFL